MKNYYIGFDTSNYTTSMAACDENGTVIANVKIPLPVREGQRGLRQSDAVFHHTRNLSDIYDLFKESIAGDERVLAVGASEKPRDAEDSYMPCFLAGRAAAKGYGAAVNAPVYFFSHQQGHIMAALYSSFSDSDEGESEMERVTEAPFAAFHVSGGTTELLYVEPDGELFKITKIGGTTDLNAGQVIDRIGVSLGLSFPCGPELEKLAALNTARLPAPKISVSGLECCLSGLENMARSLYEKNRSASETSAYTLECVAATLDKLTDNLREKYNEIPIIYAGGVMSNGIIKNRLSRHKKVYFAEARFSADNAAGIALLCRKKHLSERRHFDN